MTDWQFRNATPDDVPAVVALVESAYRGEASRAGWTTEADLLDGQRRIRRRPGVHRPAGTASCCSRNTTVSRRLRARRGAQDCRLLRHVLGRPTVQGRGTGSRVLAEAERSCETNGGCRTVRMTVIDIRDELIAWYERRGYVRTGTRSHSRTATSGSECRSAQDLRFEVLEKRL